MLGAFSVFHYILAAVVIFVFIFAFGKKRINTFVITEWFAAETPDDSGAYVRIKGRKGGMISFVLSRVGISPTVSLIVDRDNVRFMAGSWNGFDSTVTPISNICSANYGYSKPFVITAILVFGCALMIIDGLTVRSFGVVLSFLLLMVAALAYYFLHKTIKIVLVYVSGGENGFAFKRSVIERQDIDEQAAAQIISIIEMVTLGKDKVSAASVGANNEMMANREAAEKAREKLDALKAQAMHAGERAASKLAASLASAAESQAAPSGASDRKCSGCGENISSGDTFCGNCGQPVK